MRRFDRLRKLARQYAKEQGHRLGMFSLPSNLIGDWYVAKCVYCGLNCKINTNLDPHELRGLNPVAPQAEILGIKLAHFKNKKAISMGMKKKVPPFKDDLPFPKRSKGIVTGPAIHSKCQKYIDNI